MLKLMKNKHETHHEDVPMITTTTPSKIELARQELQAAMERREATKQEGITTERLLHTLEYDTPELWTSESLSRHQVDVLNTKARLTALKDQMAADTIAVDLADKKLAR